MLSDSITFDIDNGAEYIILGTAGLCIALIFFASATVSFAVLTGLFSTASIMYLLFCMRGAGKWGARMWNWCMDHPVIVDVVMTFAFAYIFGASTAVALLAAGVAGIVNSALLILVKKFAPNEGKVDMTKFNNVQVLQAA